MVVGSVLKSNIEMRLELVFAGVKSVTVDQKRVFLQVDAYISQVTVDHGLQLWVIWSRSPDCDFVSVKTILTGGVGLSEGENLDP